MNLEEVSEITLAVFCDSAHQFHCLNPLIVSLTSIVEIRHQLPKNPPIAVQSLGWSTRDDLIVIIVESNMARDQRDRSVLNMFCFAGCAERLSLPDHNPCGF
jgi:hypothetical protein